eukprot:1519231-Amphidinium_carterae.1
MHGCIFMYTVFDATGDMRPEHMQPCNQGTCNHAAMAHATNPSTCTQGTCNRAAAAAAATAIDRRQRKKVKTTMETARTLQPW